MTPRLNLGRKKGPSCDKNKWTVYVKDAFNHKAEKPKIAKATMQLKREIQNLINAEGKQNKFKITLVSKNMGAVRVDCNEAFGKKMKNLPSAGLATYDVFYHTSAPASKSPGY